MHLNTSIESAVMELYLAYWESYITGDVDKLASFLDDNYTQVGSAESEIFYNIKDAVQFVRSTIHQVAGKVDMRNRNISLSQLDGLILISEHTDLYFEQDGTWAFYAKFRASSLLQQKDGVWKIIHQHSSMPDLRAQDGENIAIEKVTKENFELRDAIKRRTVELEYKNRELEMETSLERVRTVAMGMRNGADLMDICEVLFTELEKLGFDGLRNAMINIYDDANEVFLNYDYAPGPGKTVTPFAYNIHPVIQRQVSQLRSSKDAVSEIVISGNELAEFRNMRVSNGEADDPRFDTITAINYYFYSTGVGAIGISTFNTITAGNRNVLQRFRNVFDLAYQRYMDISHAEEQARESLVQLSLERVRARTMAMQQSEELPEAANTLFLQVQALGIPAWSAGYCIWDEDKKAAVACMSSEGVIQKPFKIPITGDPSFVNFYDAYSRGDKFYVKEIGGEALVSHYRFMRTLPVVGEVLDGIVNAGFPLPTFQIFHVAFFAQGYLLFITYEKVPEAHEIFKRFTQVFEQTYTRFLDLQKAEAQAREAQIESALERVRSRSMGMQKSEELKEVIKIIYQQLAYLKINCDHAGFVIDYTPGEDWHFWIADEQDIPAKITHPYFDSVWANQFNAAKLTGANLFATYLDFEEKNKFYTELLSYVPGLPESTKDFYLSCPALAASTVLLDTVGLYIENFSGIPYSDEENNILLRFGKVFEQTYTRFLDLKKAESQVREAQIEAALERVRSTSLAIHQSNELEKVVVVLFDKLKELGVPFDSAFIYLFEKTKRDIIAWVASNLLQAPVKVNMPYDEAIVSNPIVADLWYAIETGEHGLNKSYKEKDKDDYYKYEARYNKSIIPESITDLQLQAESWTTSFATEKNSIVGFDSWKGQLTTSEDFQLLKRFAKVFEQAYIRFLDLQKAETQAREAIKRASVDRVRAEIASMRTTNDLSRITPLIWNELTTLGVPFIRCGVFIMDETKQEVQTYLSSPDGQAIASFQAPYNTPGQTTEIIAHWRKKELYTQYWDEAAFIEYTNTLIQQGAINSGEKYLTENRPTNLYLHFLPFLQGMLYAGSETALSKDELQLVQNLADAFSTAYARYEDFNKLEVAKQQVDKTLTDLKQAQSQLVQAEKMASLGELTAGIAHEIQNPLNFVNNFSEVNAELIAELQTEIREGNLEEAIAIAIDISVNEQRINHHGKRADAIVKGMLQHSRNSSSTKEPSDINALADEYLRLAYHGFRAKDKSFNAVIKNDFDESIRKINIVPQDIGRVLLNLISNSFYAVHAKAIAKEVDNFEPLVAISTKKFEDKIEIRVADNGNGIPQKILDKIFQPFFTTKPTGEGTGLGLSLAYDIIKAHGGSINVETVEGEGTTFIISLPVN